MSEKIWVTLCPQCSGLDTCVAVPSDDGSGEWRCVVCNHQFGVWLDGGRLDLGIIPPPDPDVVTIFSETFEP